MSDLPTTYPLTAEPPTPTAPEEWKCLMPAIIDQLRLAIHPFTGSLEDATWLFWQTQAMQVLNGLLPNLASPVKLSAMKTVLDPAISQEIDQAHLTTWAQVVTHMETHYSDACWTNHYLAGLQAKSLFKGKSIDQVAALAKEAAWHLGGTPFWMIKMVELLLGQFAAKLKQAPSALWDFHALSSPQLYGHIQLIVKEVKLGQMRVQIQHQFAAANPMANRPASKPASKPAAKPAPATEATPMPPAEDSKAKQRHHNQEARLKARIDELERQLQANPSQGKA